MYSEPLQTWRVAVKGKNNRYIGCCFVEAYNRRDARKKAKIFGIDFVKCLTAGLKVTAKPCEQPADFINYPIHIYSEALQI